MIDDEEAGDWWESIESAPIEGRVLLAFPPVDRPRREGEKKQRRIRVNGKLKPNEDDHVRYPSTIAIGTFVGDEWRPGRKSKRRFSTEPTHWMHLPDLPDSYAAD